MEKKLIVMVGLPRSGKSTWARAEASHVGAAIVSPDAIRLALHGLRFAAEAEDHVWAIAKTMVRSLFLAGHDTVIVDATHVTKKRRDFWKPQTALLNWKWDIEFVHIPTPSDVCILRAVEEGDGAIIPVIRRMAGEFEPVDPSEGPLNRIGG